MLNQQNTPGFTPPPSSTVAVALRQAWSLVSSSEAPESRLFGEACRLLRAGDARVTALLAPLDAYPSFTPGWLLMGAVLRDRAQPAAALIACNRVLEVEPNRDAYYIAAQCHRALGCDEAALSNLKRTVTLDERFAEGWYSLGVLLQDRHQSGAAALAYRQALNAEPNHHEAAMNLGVALQELGELEPALDAYGVAYRLRPESFGRIAQSLVSGRVGTLWLAPDQLRKCLSSA